MNGLRKRKKLKTFYVGHSLRGHSILYPPPSPMEEVSQNLPPKKSKIKSADTCPPPSQKFSFPLRKRQFFSKPPSEIFKRSKAPTQRPPQKWRSRPPQKISSIGWGGMFIPNRTFLVRFGPEHIRLVWSSHGSYFGSTASRQNTHGETKRAWCTAEAYQKRCD